MSVKHLVLYLIIFQTVLVSSCTKTAEGIQGPAGAAGTAGRSVSDQRSAIYGYVLLVDQFTRTDTVLDLVHVSTKMGDSALSVQTDKTGKFFLPALKSGTYRLLFARNGYDSIGVNIDHIAGNEDQFIGIIQVDGSQTTKISGQTLQILQSPFDNVSKYVDMFTTVTGPPLTDANQRYIDIYFSDSRNVNSHNSLYAFNTYSHSEGTNVMESQVFFGGSEINSSRFKPGDTVFMKTYIRPPYSLDKTWFDTNTYQTISYPYLGDSVSNYFIWPN